MKILILSHGHPELSMGGAERAAYSLFLHLKSVPGVDPIFIARAEPSQIGHDGWFGAFRGKKDEFLWAPPPFDWFRIVSLQHDILQNQIEVIADRFRPDIVHFHHYFFFGLEAFGLFKKCGTKGVVLTLHEFGFICVHNGQMVKTNSLRLCYAASSAECSSCFPEISSGKFFLREKLIKSLSSCVDKFISPSRFLKERYTFWGLAAERIQVTENLLPPNFNSSTSTSLSFEKSSNSKRGRIRFGYFGQINPYKGANVLLDSLKHLSDEISDKLEIVIFGARLEEQKPEFRALLEEQIKHSSSRVSFFGPYRNEDVPNLLRKVDWMVIPSIWWENSPVVIQEAKAVGIPILASNIGGMAEKVTEGTDGIHFLAGSAIDCASKIEQIVLGEVVIAPTKVQMSRDNDKSLVEHLDVYRALH